MVGEEIREGGKRGGGGGGGGRIKRGEDGRVSVGAS